MSKKFVANLDHYDPQSNPTTAEWHVSWLLIGSLSEWQLRSEGVTVQVLAPNLILAGGAVMSCPYGSGAVQVRLAAVDQGILRDAAGRAFQRVILSAAFDDTNNWQDPRSEQVVRQAIINLEAGVAALSGTPGPSWKLEEGYWLWA
jgi:hypothetical protein